MLNSAPVTPPSARSLSLTLPAASHQSRSPSCIHISQITQSHTPDSLPILYIPFTPLTLCLVSSLHGRSYRPRRPAPQPCFTGFRLLFIRSLDFHVRCLPRQQVSCLLTSRTTLPRVPCIRLQVYRDFLVRPRAVGFLFAPSGSLTRV